MFGRKNKCKVKSDLRGLKEFKETAGVILSEKQLMQVLQPHFQDDIKHVTTERDSFVVHFDHSKPVNASTLGHEDLKRVFREYYGRSIIQVTTFSGGHEQYLVRFEE